MEPLRWNGLGILGCVSLAGYLLEGLRRKHGSSHPCNAATANALQHNQFETSRRSTLRNFPQPEMKGRALLEEATRQSGRIGIACNRAYTFTKEP